MPTLEQRIAQKENELAKLREKSRKLENAQKIILGGMLIQAARKDPRIRAWLLDAVEKSVTREADRKRLKPILDELRGLTRGGGNVS
jgi:hypothetical protein